MHRWVGYLDSSLDEGLGVVSRAEEGGWEEVTESRAEEGGDLGGWVGGWVGCRTIEEDEAVRMSDCELGVGSGWMGGGEGE